VAAHDVTAALVAEVRGTFGANGSDELQQLELVASFSSDYRRAADHIRYILFRLPSKYAARRQHQEQRVSTDALSCAHTRWRRLYLLVRSSLALITNLNGRQCCIQVIKASPFLTAFATPHRFLPLPPPWAVSST